ncbi:PLDc N-terminal domain-containing protein [Clostridium botulinum]|nr:PLDc N-terminal domain-containing protein [Clostridium botulinum]MCS4464648.1 PLDc N-terminal domain-containing protein [Clostridium botulinum]MCS4468970.1 PLDc N-terminal domain-containing protein [Clostridium botulinum]MCS4515564.1 PLDc N-terminal domain-containing protein [Clostridium botulinum]MCS4524490.1 PLDc N-terminal domain-containing protein [Clostridium botulinum]
MITNCSTYYTFSTYDFCLSKLFKQDFTNYLSKQLWIFIIMFFSIIGPISYLHFENWRE